MKIYLEQGAVKESLRNVLRRCGYAEINDRHSGKTSYVRRLGAYFYPRFHLYIDQTEDKIIMNLHLDQKKASYKGQTAHSGEYDEDLVQEEAGRIKNILKSEILNTKL